MKLAQLSNTDNSKKGADWLKVSLCALRNINGYRFVQSKTSLGEEITEHEDINVGIKKKLVIKF